MSRRGVCAGLVAVAIVAGTAADQPVVRPALILGGYRVLAADFHLHSSMWSDGALTPWGLVLEAERQGLDAIAITGHNEVADSKVGRWFADLVGGPTVLTGEEIMAPGHHVIAVGIDRVVDWRLGVADEIDDVHRQGGVAIAAHPSPSYWPAFDAAAMARLDGAEIDQPQIFGSTRAQRDLDPFAAGADVAAICSSDFHGIGRLGRCRTYVFSRDTSAAAILDALRAHRTVVYGPHGTAYGDPALVPLAAAHSELRRWATEDTPSGWLDWVSRVCGVIGLGGLAVRGLRGHTR